MTEDPGSLIPVGPVPPQSLDAEESLLGAMMLSPRAIDAVAETGIAAADFYRESHGTIYAAIVALHSRGEPADAITVVHELDRRQELEKALGAEHIHELAALVPAASNAAHYARIVSNLALRRVLIRTGNHIAKIGFEGNAAGGEGVDLLEEAEQAVFEVSQRRERTELVSAREAVPAAFRRIQELAETGQDIIGSPTGFRDLDRLTSGFHPGNLVVLAARPSMGKSGLALGIVAHVAVHAGLPVVLFTLEMSQDEVMQRLLSLEGMVDSQRIRNGRRLDSEDWSRLLAASGRIEQAPIYVDDSGLITVGEIRSKARRLKARHPNLGLIVVDYLQLMTSDGSEENRVQQIAAISRSLKILAREVQVPVLALSQLSRQVEGRHDKRPMLQDLRESGAIEQDADVVAFIYRDEYYNPDEFDNVGIAEVIVGKQRNGPTGTVKLHFKKEYARFSDLTHDYSS